MSAIAGIARDNCREAVLSMLDAMKHREAGPCEVISDEICTLGMIHPAGVKQDQTFFSYGSLKHSTGRQFSTRAYLFLGKLHLQRDPLGISPLYYGYTAEGVLCFASEVKALLTQTRKVFELLPGTIFDGQTTQAYAHLELKPVFTDPPAALAEKLRKRLDRVVQKAIAQDAMGAWLSGGLDSGTIVALARPHIKTLHTFVAGLAGAPDLDAARAVADYVKTIHHEIVISTKDLIEVLPTVIYHLESFDALLVRSSLANFIAGHAAREFVSEIFSGEGGDELFAGYRYLKSLPTAELAAELVNITNRLHNTALQRVDRCSSAHALTAKVCFLDPAIVEFAMKIPAEYKIRDGVEKWIVREAIHDILPPQIVSRPKAKFWEGAGVGEILAEYANKEITDADFARERCISNGWVLTTKEELMYYRIFREHFGGLDNLDWMGRTPNPE